MNTIQLDEYKHQIWYFHDDYPYYFLKLSESVLKQGTTFFRCSSASPDFRFRFFAPRTYGLLDI